MDWEKALSEIRIGVFGLRRGSNFVTNAQKNGMQVVAVCDKWAERAREIGQSTGARVYDHFDIFLQHDMDAVVMTNYFNQHAPYAIRALQAGKHVISETSACKTLAEAVALARAVEKSGKIYMFAENYAYAAAPQAMRRLYQQDAIGELQYAEGSYNHPMSAVEANRLAPGPGHWRNNMPATYYCTHSISPLMYVTDLRPVSVNARCIPFSERDGQVGLTVRRKDAMSIILCAMENGAVVRLSQGKIRGHGTLRFHGSRGFMERRDDGNLHVTHPAFDLKEGEEADMAFKPDFGEFEELARNAGHGGGDFFVMRLFGEAIVKGEQPWMNVYRGLDMSVIGIQGYRSALAQGAPFEIPDFRDEAVRRRYEKDDWSPYPEDRRPGQPWPSILGEIRPTAEALAYAQKIWDEAGFPQVPYP